MIKNFEQYNEGLTDKMTPKSDEEINNAINNALQDFQKLIDNNEFKDVEDKFYSIIDMLLKVYGIKGDSEEIKFLTDVNILDANTILQYELDSIVNYMMESGDSDIFETIIDLIKDKIK